MDETKELIKGKGRIGIEKFRDEIIDINKEIDNYKSSPTQQIIREIFHMVLSLVREEHICRTSPEIFSNLLLSEMDGIMMDIEKDSIEGIYKRLSKLYLFELDDIYLDGYQIKEPSSFLEDIKLTKCILEGINDLLNGTNFIFSERLDKYKSENPDDNFRHLSSEFVFLFNWIQRNLRSVHSESFYTELYRKNRITTSFWAADDELLALDLAKATLAILEGDTTLFNNAIIEYYKRPTIQKDFLYCKIRNYIRSIRRIILNLERQ
ncbi:MAG: hypothetical protein GYA51_00995 [Candidatus Methanofastidiosa archaeon]|nr:hypothetical protein [Candidatus Methanofastidiosa archaeon]